MKYISMFVLTPLLMFSAGCATDRSPSRAGSNFIENQEVVKALMQNAMKGDEEAAALLALHFAMGMHCPPAAEIWKKWAHDLGYQGFKDPALEHYYRFDPKMRAKLSSSNK